MDEELKRYLDDAAEQRQRVRENRKISDPEYQRQYNKAQAAIAALRERQHLESLGRWVINKCLIQGLSK